MLLNISGRTDIVAHYPTWLFKRFEEGFVLSRNSLFPNSVRRYDLSPDKVDCLIFGSKNYAPVLNRIQEITKRFNTYFYYTITAYDKDIEPGVPSIAQSIDCLSYLAEIVEPKRIAWRYDPVLLTNTYTAAYHLETFDSIASQIAGKVDRCIFSFVEMYKKHERNLPELIPLTQKDMSEIARGLGGIAQKRKLLLQTCGPEEDYRQHGIQTSGCVTLDILGKANALTFKNLKHRGFRNGCHCIESRDIGSLNSCLSGCRYCYANKDAELPLSNYALHDPESPLLIGHVKSSDKVEAGSQKSFLAQQSQIHP